MKILPALLFFAMVLAPCVLAVWGRRRDSQDEHEGALGASSADATNSVTNVSFTQTQLDSTEVPEPASIPVTVDSAAGLVSAPSLEALLRVAHDEARAARADARQASAHAAAAVAEAATLRAEAALEAARLAQLRAAEAGDAYLAAEQALERHNQVAVEVQETIGILEHRRAA